jgi:hypothetical protein
MGAGLVIEAIHDLFPWLRDLVKFGDCTIEIVKRGAAAATFQLLLRRSGCRTHPGTLNRNCRLAKDLEASLTSWIYSASVQLLLRQLAYQEIQPTTSIPSQTLR